MYTLRGSNDATGFKPVLSTSILVNQLCADPMFVKIQWAICIVKELNNLKNQVLVFC